jgi:hypothetical protein
MPDKIFLYLSILYKVVAGLSRAGGKYISLLVLYTRKGHGKPGRMLYTGDTPGK